MPGRPRDHDDYIRVMDDTVARLKKEKIRYKVLTPYQIKVEDYNFFPCRGTVYRDGDAAKSKSKFDLDAFVALVRGREKPKEHCLIIPYDS